MFRGIQHEPGILGIQRRLEQGVIYCLEECLRLNSLPGCEVQGFAERMNHGADNETASKLAPVRLFRFCADHADASRKCLEQGAGPFDVSTHPGANEP